MICKFFHHLISNKKIFNVIILLHIIEQLFIIIVFNFVNTDNINYIQLIPNDFIVFLYLTFKIAIKRPIIFPQTFI